MSAVVWEQYELSEEDYSLVKFRWWKAKSSIQDSAALV